MIFYWVEIAHLYISGGHNYFGHHGQAPGVHPIIEVQLIECVAGHGVRGDRFFDYKDSYKGQITLFSGEVFDALCDAFRIYDKPASVLRRNVITREQDVAKAAEIESWADQVAALWNVLPMDAATFRAWARLMHRRSDALIEDAMIAATARVHGLQVVTRNVRDFKNFGIPVFNPYASR